MYRLRVWSSNDTSNQPMNVWLFRTANNAECTRRMLAASGKYITRMDFLTWV